MSERRILVTGGAGFIGSHLVDLLLERHDVNVTVLDNLTYAGSTRNLVAHEQDTRYAFVRGDVADATVVDPLVEWADHVVHGAAESFVDRSIVSSRSFVVSNVLGTHVMLEACRRSGKPMLLVSTDEVYGSRTDQAFTEDAPLLPNSPYAATKAAAEMLARSHVVTYGSAITVVRGTNAFGPRQHPEKAIPMFVLSALRGNPIPVYGDGSNQREWLHVTDFVRAISTVLDRGQPGTVYNIGGGTELSNIELARRVCRLLGQPFSIISHTPDRLGHDFRYGVVWDRLDSLGWRATVPFDAGLAATVAWYEDNSDWVEAVMAGASV
jgi:dTDP-glucose 4,6-dehydratase